MTTYYNSGDIHEQFMLENGIRVGDYRKYLPNAKLARHLKYNKNGQFVQYITGVFGHNPQTNFVYVVNGKRKLFQTLCDT